MFTSSLSIHSPALLCPALPCLASAAHSCPSLPPLPFSASLLIHASLPLLQIALDRPIASVGSPRHRRQQINSAAAAGPPLGGLSVYLLSAVCLSAHTNPSASSSPPSKLQHTALHCTALPSAHIRPHSSPNNTRRHRRNPALDIPCAARRTLSTHNTTPPAASHISAPRPTLMNAHQLLPSMQCHSERPPASANR